MSLPEKKELSSPPKFRNPEVILKTAAQLRTRLGGRKRSDLDGKSKSESP
jgi:hypothetical protein